MKSRYSVIEDLPLTASEVGTRNVVESAIDAAKSDRSSCWDKSYSKGAVLPWDRFGSDDEAAGAGIEPAPESSP